MTDRDHSPTLIPDSAEVRRVLSGIRYNKALADSPLADLDAVWDILLREGVAPGARGHAWALGVLIDEIVTEHLDAARRAAGISTSTEVASAAQLAADFAANSPELEMWSVLYYRYLDSGQLRAGEIAARAGMPRRSLGRRLDAAHRELAKSLAVRNREAARRLAERSDVPIIDPIAGRRGAQPDALSEPGDALLRAVRGTGQGKVAVAPDALERLASERPKDLNGYRLSRLAAWSRPAYRVDSRFVNLTLLIDRGEDAPDRWQAEDETYDDIGGVLKAVASSAVVLLGPPGSGKSTLLRRFELDLAVAGLRDNTQSVPFFVSLGRYGADPEGAEQQAPAAWLANLWGRRYPDLPPLFQLLDDRRLVLLLDGLNEMPHRGADDYRARILAWKHFLRETIADRPGVRVVFACRSLDYGAPLSTSEQRVPQVRVEPMTDEQMRSFLNHHAPAQADAIWGGLRRSPQLEIVRSPYLLALLVEQAITSGTAPVGRAALFTGFVRRALQREIERDNPLFRPGAMLDEREYRLAIAGRSWATPWSLPDRGALVPCLTRLAHGMQARFVDGRASQTGVSYDTAIELIDHPMAEDVLRAGEALAVLDEHRGHDEVLFFHQLLQEYFAARHLAADPEGAAARSRTELRATAAVPALESVVAELEITEPLPPLPSTGWEEIVLLAASMSETPAVFVAAVAEVNPSLAGRAASQPELAERLPVPLLAVLRDRLVEMSGDQDIDLRARIEAGLALGVLGDPRFELRAGPDGPYLRPPMVEVPAGEHVIGDDSEPGSAFGPQHSVCLAAFEIGRFPVTNGEWSRFMASGGYDDDRWWDTPDAKAWRRGVLTAEGSRRWVRDWLEKMRGDPSLIETYVELGLNPDQESMWRARLVMDEQELRDHLERKFPRRKYSAPYSANHALHAAPAQPVSGICWYEARAFCRWLSVQTGQDYRLPSEAEWEAAARGGAGGAYPWGDRFVATACNTAESHLRRAAPVGVMPLGRSPYGAEMLTGDVWEWTASLWGADADVAAYRYPYVAGDGREKVDAPPTIRRVQRGGSCFDSAAEARVFLRNGLPPDTRFHGFGMRLVRSRAEE